MNGVTPVFAAIMCVVGLSMVVGLAIICRHYAIRLWSVTDYDDL